MAGFFSHVVPIWIHLPERLLEYGKLMHSGATVNRLGHVLEKFGYDCEALLKYRSERSFPLSSTGLF